MKSTIKLFKAVPITVKKTKKANKDLLEKTIKRGFVFAPEVVYNYPNCDELIKLIEVGMTPEELNNSFHKSWGKVKEASMEQLVAEQIVHYITTYGFKSLGIYDKDSVYIPNEKLEIPEIEEDIKFTVIKGYTKKELKEKLLKLLDSGIALKEETIVDIVDVALFVKLNKKEIEGIKNKEVRVIMYDYLGLIPASNTEFLRFIVYKQTGKTLLIKSPELIEELKEHNYMSIVRLFHEYEKQYGLDKLAEIFYRFKPIFLAFRKNSEMKRIVNKIRRLAVRHHKPMPEDYLNEITAKVKKGEKIDTIVLKKELDKVNVFRKIRLAYALKFRTKDVDSILYKIRNGKGYATDFSFEEKNRAKRILAVVLDSIIKDVSKNVKGKKVYIPEFINYSLPATEKQFVGNFPSGTFVSMPKDMIAGIHWENVRGHQIDLDLSLMSPEAGKIGWDSSYRSESGDILFSGDITDAPKGASELFYVQRQAKDAFILFVNYYNYDPGVKVPFSIIVAKEQVSNFGKNYMVDPNNIVSIAEFEIDQRQKILGLIVTTTNECRFYFVETAIGKSITSSGSEFAENSRKYLFNFYENTINLKDVLSEAGARIIDDKEKADIDLSPENLEKDSILNLIS
jgi:hypothetical protein